MDIAAFYQFSFASKFVRHVCRLLTLITMVRFRRGRFKRVLPLGAPALAHSTSPALTSAREWAGCQSYWEQDFPTLSDRTRSARRMAAMAWKWCFQLAVMRRHGAPGQLRPVFLWADEAQNFITERDALTVSLAERDNPAWQERSACWHALREAGRGRLSSRCRSRRTRQRRSEHRPRPRASFQSMSTVVGRSARPHSYSLILRAFHEGEYPHENHRCSRHDGRKRDPCRDSRSRKKLERGNGARPIQCLPDFSIRAVVVKRFQANNSNFCRSRARASLRDQPLALPAWDQQEETEQSDFAY